MASQVTEAEEGHGLLSHTQFVESSENKRALYTVHRAGYTPHTQTRRRATLKNEWKEESSNTKALGGQRGRKTTRTVRAEEGEWKRVVNGTKPMKTRLHAHG